MLFSDESGGVFARGYRKWILINTLSYDPDNRKLRFFGALERALHMPGKLTGFLVSRHADPNDRLNTSRGAWSAPWDASLRRTESFIDLFDRAQSEASILMNAAYDAMDSGDYTRTLTLIGARRMDARPV
jgi:hypothetical protein